MEKNQVSERPSNGGVQKLYRFENEYGASVIRHDFSYGNKEGLWELAVINFYGDEADDFDLNYDTCITDDVLRHLTDEKVLDVLEKIKTL